MLNTSNLKACLWCKDKFVPRLAGRPQKFCSKLCKREYEKEIRKIGLKLINLESPILNARLSNKEGS